MNAAKEVVHYGVKS